MSMEEIVKAWEEFVEKGLNGCPVTGEAVNDFCNIYATSYEEYMALWELLSEMVEGE